MNMPEQTLQRLLDGNRRFAEGKPALDESEMRRKMLVEKQDPFAIIFGCADSRVPPELVFDQGLGELFVIRTAGEVLDRAVLGTLEFGVLELKIPLIVVLGHQNCAAVKTARETLRKHAKANADIEYLVEELALAVEIGDEQGNNDLDKEDQAVRGQVISDVVRLKRLPALKPALEKGELKVVGGWYDLETGLVEIIIE
jgi:carbonic anhydrase